MTDLTARAVERLSKLLDRPITMAVPQVYYDLICDPWHLFAADIQVLLSAYREAAILPLHGLCHRSGGCVCGGDPERIRKACVHWREELR